MVVLQASLNQGKRNIYSDPPTPVFLPGKFHRQQNLVGYSPGGHKESATTEQLGTHIPGSLSLAQTLSPSKKSWASLSFWVWHTDWHKVNCATNIFSLG